MEIILNLTEDEAHRLRRLLSDGLEEIGGWIDETGRRSDYYVDILRVSEKLEAELSES